MFPTLRAPVTALIVASALLAGCLSGDEVEQEASNEPEAPLEPEVTDTTGSIRGTASSESFEPLAGARATLLDDAREATGMETLVARDGVFVFNGVEPGTYFVHVAALGYDSAQRGVGVEAGKVSEVALQLTALKDDGPWRDEREWVGKVVLSVAWQVEPSGVGCVIVDNPVTPAKSCGGIRLQGPDDIGEVAIESGEDAKTVTAALVWSSAGPLGDTLLFDFMCSDTPRSEGGGAVLDPEHPCYFYPDKTTSPVVHRVDETHWIEHDYNYTGDWAARVFATYGTLGTYDLAGVDLGVAYEQAFTIYATTFHGEPAPEGYSPVPDS